MFFMHMFAIFLYFQFVVAECSMAFEIVTFQHSPLHFDLKPIVHTYTNNLQEVLHRIYPEFGELC